MSLKIEVFVPTEIVQEERATKYVNQAMSAIGFSRLPQTVWLNAEMTSPAPAQSEPAASAITEPEGQKAASPDTVEPPKKRGRAAKAETPAPATEPERAISTGEARVGPEDTPETTAQDAADEAAEQEKADDTPMTVDDVRRVLGSYMHAFGQVAVQEDAVKIFESVLGAPPAGMAAWKASAVPAEVIPKVVAAFEKAIAENPYGRKQ